MSLLTPAHFADPEAIEQRNKFFNLKRENRSISFTAQFKRRGKEELNSWDAEYSFTLSDLQYEVHGVFLLQGLRSEKYGSDNSEIYDLVIKMKLTFEEIISRIGVKNIEHTEEISTLPPGVYGEVDNNEALKNFLPIFLLLVITIDNFTMRTNLAKNTTKKEEAKLVENLALLQ